MSRRGKRGRVARWLRVAPHPDNLQKNNTDCKRVQTSSSWTCSMSTLSLSYCANETHCLSDGNRKKIFVYGEPYLELELTKSSALSSMVLMSTRAWVASFSSWWLRSARSINKLRRQMAGRGA
jgi:hypothetical protein